MIRISAATVEDAQALSDLGRETFLDAHSSSASPSDLRTYVDRVYTPDIVRSEISDPANRIYVVRSDARTSEVRMSESRLAGYSKIVPNRPPPGHPQTGHPNNGSNFCKLERLYIRKEFYGQRLGLELFQFNVKLAREIGQTGLWLFVWTGNIRAIEFYRKAGFEIGGEHMFKISDTHSNPNHWMQLKF